jgi:hypothetical protein
MHAPLAGRRGCTEVELLKQSVAAFSSTKSVVPVESSSLGGFIPGLDLSDHWSFWQNGYPGIMVTDTAMFRYAHYHKNTDTPDRLDYARMAAVVDGMAAVLKKLSNSQ